MTNIQLNKLADELLLEPDETITDAYFELGRLHVTIEDGKGNTTDYQPEFEQSQLNKILKEGKSMKLIKESATLSSKGKKALKESFNKNSKKLNETFAGMDVIDDLVDRAMGYVHDDYSAEDAIHQAIDDGLIYTRDIIDLAEHYGVIDTSELFDRFYEDLFNDMYTEVTKQIEIDEEDEEELNGDVTEALTENTNAKSLADFIQDALNGLKADGVATYYYNLGGDLYYVMGADNAKNYDAEDLKELALTDNGNPIVGKIAVNCDDLQCDYDMDWNMPYNSETGDVWDTETNFYNNDNVNARASEIIAEYEDLKDLKLERDGKIIEGKPLQEVMVDIDEDDLLELLMNRLKRWTDDPVATELYEQMYQSYIDADAFSSGKFDPMVIVDNDWVNYCDVVGPGEENYDALLKLYQENGLGDVSVEDVGYSFIEAATEDNGTTYLLCRW